jgi:DNA-binding beta-propeller fold protein YncE
MTRFKCVVFITAATALLASCGGDGPQVVNSADAQAPVAPRFEVDPFWPKPLPNNWVIGSAIGVSVDSRDHVWMIHRGEALNTRTEASAGTNTPDGECCSPAPPVLEFDPEGNLVGWWGGPGEGFDWPQSNHGLTVDHMDNIWIGGNGEDDAHLLKFSRDGDFLLQVGMPGATNGSNDAENFGRVAKISIDAEANEAYVADGYLNKRVAVIDMNTGEINRFWGAYGNRPDDTDLGNYDPAAPPADQFRNPVHCAEPTPDGFVYVCDRANDRIQVFRKDGEFVDELMVAPLTLGDGSAWDIAFSRDPEQTYLYLADGLNEKIYIIERASLEVLMSFGQGGRQPGQFFAVHSIATDSSGNLYTTETYEGKRLQKFVNLGLEPVPAESQGTLWPE